MNTSKSVTIEESLNRYKDLLSKQEYQKLTQSLKQTIPPALRINPIKTSCQDLDLWKEKYGWDYQPIPYCPTGYWLTTCSTPPGPTIEHRMGAFYIQDAASMLPVELFEFSDHPNPLILDMAASPGGKTTHICSRTLDQGLILANDSSHDRTKALILNMQNWGAINLAVTQLPGSYFGHHLADFFDYVLLDAPCSMQGLRSTDRHPIRPISRNEQTGLVKRQIDLLDASLHTVKVGGQVIYSTCTLSPEENECVLDFLVNRYRNKISIIDVTKKLKIPPALTQYEGRHLAKSIRGAARIWPYLFGTAGFFASLISKEGSLVENFKRPMSSPNKPRAEMENPSRKEEQLINHEMRNFLSKSLYDIAEYTHTRITKRDRFWYLVPVHLPFPLAEIPIHSIGMCIAENTPDGLLPTHEFLSRFSKFLADKKLSLEHDQVGAWMRGQDLQKEIRLEGNPYISIIDENGSFIGRGKCLHNRVRNLFPRHLI